MSAEIDPNCWHIELQEIDGMLYCMHCELVEDLASDDESLQ